MSDLLKAAEDSEATAKEEDPTTVKMPPTDANGKQKATEQKISTRRPGRGKRAYLNFIIILWVRGIIS